MTNHTQNSGWPSTWPSARGRDKRLTRLVLLAGVWLLVCTSLLACEGRLGDPSKDRPSTRPSDKGLAGTAENERDGDRRPGDPGDYGDADGPARDRGDDGDRSEAAGDGDATDSSSEGSESTEDGRSNMERPMEAAFHPPNPSIINNCEDDDGALRGAANPSARKLGKEELLASLKGAILARHRYSELEDVAGFKDQTFKNYDQIEPLQLAMNAYPPDSAEPAGEAFVETFSGEQLSAWSQVADLVASRFASAGWAQEYTASSCFDPDAPEANEACHREFVSEFGAVVFRRPLSEAEVERLVTFAQEAESTEDGVYRVVARLFISPQFMYTLGLGDGAQSDEDAGRVRLSQHEVAIKVAFALTGQPPDGELRAAADAGQLSSLDEVRDQASRIIRTDRAKSHLREFFNAWLDIDGIVQPNRAWANWAKVPDKDRFGSNRLDQNMRDEVEDFLRHIIWDQEGTYDELLTAPIAFVKDNRMQVVYQTDGFDASGAPVSTPTHPGLLTRAGLLSSQGLLTNPIHRAITIKTKALCQEIPSPDFTVVAARQEGVAELDPAEHPNHDIYAELTSPDACRACHQYINPVGFLFETYNPLGQREDVQNVVRNVHDPDQWPLPVPELEPYVRHAVLVSHPLPGPQSLLIEDGLPDSFSSPDELVEAIGQSEAGPACLSVRFFRYLARRSETTPDACRIADGFERMRGGKIIDAFVDLLVNEDIFWRMQ